MTDKIKKTKRDIEIEQAFGELTADLQRTRADFENYCKRADGEKASARESGKTSAILNLLPVIDGIERAISYTPENLKEDQWVKGITSLVKNLEKSLENMNVKRIVASPGTLFNPELHDAISMEDSAAESSQDAKEVISEEMQAGYTLNNIPIRHAMVRVTRK